VKRNQITATVLREAVNAFRAKYSDTLDEWARGLLARLANSPNAAQAFERLKLKDHREEIEVLKTCIEAQELARTFANRIKIAKETLVYMEQLDTALAVLRKFIIHLNQKKSWPYSGMFSPVIEDNKVTMVRGLELIADRIEMERCIAKESLARFGASRKSHIREAAENAAIWWLAQEINGIFGARDFLGIHQQGANIQPAIKLHRREIADLAEEVLGSDVSLERLRHAVVMREKRYRQMLASRAQRRIPAIRKMIANLRRLKGL
jgi:hypothetical protein